MPTAPGIDRRHETGNAAQTRLQHVIGTSPELPDDMFWRLLNADGRIHIAGAGVTPRCFERFTEFIDFFVLEDAAMALKLPGSFVETTFSGPRELFPSDHCPIHIDLRLQ